LRPTLVLLSARACGEVADATYQGAALVELLHTATLVHDDVVDNADRRRGIFSINALWKNKIAVLVGDFLLSRGLPALGLAGAPGFQGYLSTSCDFGAARVVDYRTPANPDLAEFCDVDGASDVSPDDVPSIALEAGRGLYGEGYTDANPNRDTEIPTFNLGKTTIGRGEEILARCWA